MLRPVVMDLAIVCSNDGMGFESDWTFWKYSIMKKPIVFNYSDYRIYLADMYQYMKSKKRCFSYRFFSNKAGFASPNFLKLVMDNKRNLTYHSIPKIAKGFDLNEAERNFFENLVNMNQAETHTEKKHYYNNMISLRQHKVGYLLEKDKYEYFSKWYHPVVREIILFPPANHSPEQIASLLSPAISVGEAEDSLDLLLRLGLIRKDTKGHWHQTNATMTTGPEVRSVVVSNFHKEMMKLAYESIDRYPSAMRDISALILGVHKETIPLLKKKMVEFRQELIDIAAQEHDPDTVIEINMQLFPTSKQKSKRAGYASQQKKKTKNDN